MVTPVRFRYCRHPPLAQPGTPGTPTENPPIVKRKPKPKKQLRKLSKPKVKPKPPPVEVKEDVPPVPYEIRIVTGDVYGAGTDANVFFTLFGTNGDTGKIRLSKWYKDLFERGQTDCFGIDIKLDLGDLTMLRIEHDDSGFGASWYLDRVEVYNEDTKELTLFVCNDWLDKKHGIGRDLTPEVDEGEEDGDDQEQDGAESKPTGNGSEEQNGVIEKAPLASID